MHIKQKRCLSETASQDWISLFRRKNLKRHLSEVALTAEKWLDVRCETTWHPQKRDKHISYRPSREFVFAVPAGRWLSATRSSSRLRPRQPPWIKDGRRHCGNCGPRNRPARPFRWPAMNDSDIWFSPPLLRCDWVLECRTGASQTAKRPQSHKPTQPGPRGKSPVFQMK